MPQAPPATVSGVVKNRLTGQPIARALVDAQFDAMLTDREGRFELHLFEGLSTGVQVRRPGYARSGSYGLRVHGDMSGLVLYLTPTATVTGQVSTADGTDTTGMTFVAYRRTTRNGHTQWQQAGFEITNPDGVFRMHNMLPGDYVLCNHVFSDRMAGPRQGEPLRGIPSQCYPVDPSDSAANLLHLSPGQQAEIEIARTMQPFYPVKITVANQAPGAGGGFEVYSQTGVPTGANLQFKDEGWTEVDLPNGHYYAQQQNWGKDPAFGRVDFKVENGTPAALTLVAGPLAPIAVQFHKDFTAHPEEQGPGVFDGPRVVMASNDAPPAQLELMPVDSMNGGGGGRPIRHVQGAPTDLFEMDGVTPGRYWVRAGWAAEGYVSAINSGGVDLLREPLTIGPGNTVSPIEVTLRNDTGQIDCTVMGTAMPAAPGEGMISNTMHFDIAVVTLYAIPAGMRPTGRTVANTAAGGQVSIPNLAPGTYHVIALENDHDIDSLDDQDLARLEEKGKTVTVPAGGTVNVQLDLIQSFDEEPAP